MHFRPTKPVKTPVNTHFNGITIDAPPDAVFTADRGPLRVKDPYANSAKFVSANRRSSERAPTQMSLVGGFFKPTHSPKKCNVNPAPVSKVMGKQAGATSLSDQLKSKIDAGATNLVIGTTAGDLFLQVYTSDEVRSLAVKFNPMIRIRVVTFPDDTRRYVVSVTDIKFKAAINLGYKNKIIGHDIFDPATIAWAGQYLLFQDNIIKFPEIEPAKYDSRFEELQQFIAVSLFEAHEIKDHPQANKVALRYENGIWRWDDAATTRSGITLTIKHNGKVSLDLGDLYNMFGHNFVFVQDAQYESKPIRFAKDISGKTLIAGDLTLYIPTYNQALAMLGKVPPLRVVDALPQTTSDRISLLLESRNTVIVTGDKDDEDNGIIANPFYAERPYLKFRFSRSPSEDGVTKFIDETDQDRRQPLFYKDPTTGFFIGLPADGLEVTDTTFVGVVSKGGQWQGFRIKPATTTYMDYVTPLQLLQLPKDEAKNFLTNLKKFELPDYISHPVMQDYVRDGLRLALKQLFAEFDIVPGKTGVIEASKRVRALLREFHPDNAAKNGLTNEAALERSTRLATAKEIIDVLKEILR